MDKKALTHDRILTLASKTLRREGFRGVTVGAAMKDAGLTHGGFYAHFASQDALLKESLQRAGTEGYRALALAVDAFREREGVSRFRAFVEVYLSEAHVRSAETGCVISALCAEIPRQSEAVQAVARDQLRTLVSSVAGVLADPSSAEAVAAAMVGALSMARALPSDAARSLLTAVRADLLARFDRNLAVH
jgi:AcrR family transcriptional regulator